MQRTPPKRVTKTELMQKIIDGKGHESFFHSDCGCFDITLMRAWAKEHLNPVLIGLPDILPFILTTRVFEEARLLDLDPHDLHNDPALVILYEDGSRLFIDGTHRAIRLHREGNMTQLAYMVPEQHIIRPDKTILRGELAHGHFDWGDTIVDGVIVKRT